jgi:hypothetical protein
MSDQAEPGTHPSMGWTGDDVVPSQCWLCANRNKDPRYPGNYCRAFPGGIPLEFQINQVDHREPVDYDGGIKFELDPAANPGAYLRLDAYFRNRELGPVDDEEDIG